MSRTAKSGLPVLGLIFLALGLFKFINGDAWVVWFVLGFIFGGFGIFGSNRSGGTES